MHRIALGSLPPGAGRVVRRTAVKAVVEVDGRLLLLRTPATGDLKLPGGGAHADEDPAATLRRELAEECGRVLDEAGPALVEVVEQRADLEDPRRGFEMVSTYYRATLTDERVPRALDDYEAALHLEPVWLPAAEAVAVLDVILRSGAPAPWTAREHRVLSLLAADDPGARS